MTKTLTITLSDAQYEALEAAAARAQQSPEALAEATIEERLHATASDAGAPSVAPVSEDPAITVLRARGLLADPRSALLAGMRERGHLADLSTLPPYPGVEDIPPSGTPERKKFGEELGNDLSDALEQSGLSILDLIERR